MLVVIVVIFVLVGSVLAVLAFENVAILAIEVHMRVFGWHVPALPLGLLVLLAFLLGALLLYSVTVLSAWKDRRQLARLRRRVEELEQAQMFVGMQQFSMPATIPMPGLQKNPPSQWLN